VKGNRVAYSAVQPAVQTRLPRKSLVSGWRRSDRPRCLILLRSPLNYTSGYSSGRADRGHLAIRRASGPKPATQSTAQVAMGHTG